MKDLMPVLDDLEQRLDRIDGRVIRVGVTDERARERDSGEHIHERLRRRKIVRER